MTPAFVAELGTVCLSANTLGWKEKLLSWLNSRPHDISSTLEALFDKYIPRVVDFLRPVLAGSEVDDALSLSTVVMTDSVISDHIEPQDMMLSEVHLISTCCHVLEVTLHI